MTMWATSIVAEELAQELDTLGRRSQIAVGGWLDVFTLRRMQEGRGRRRMRTSREAWTGAAANR